MGRVYGEENFEMSFVLYTGFVFYDYIAFLNATFRHDRRGMLSMANNGADTNASQFFITYSSQPHLNDKYTIFGKCVK